MNAHYRRSYPLPHASQIMFHATPIGNEFGIIREGLLASKAKTGSGVYLTNMMPAPEEGFVSLFDGKSLDGWKVGDNAGVFSAHDGMIVMECSNHRPAHLFYEGDVNHHTFKNFDLRVDVMTYPGCNSGIYFHTKFQDAGFPRLGIECQVDNSHSDWRRTGSLYESGDGQHEGENQQSQDDKTDEAKKLIHSIDELFCPRP